MQRIPNNETSPVGFAGRGVFPFLACVSIALLCVLHFWPDLHLVAESIALFLALFFAWMAIDQVRGRIVLIYGRSAQRLHKY
ncbi:hypothetical protein [Paraburkholderia sp. SIMBA_054]|uniref:hypothetical protein n=1 Tax=Paraburkholderia sp. SIMBA_054 TaxID=3085795 RepID=UPI00397A1CFC